jgi:small subunit ribosomal protein S20
LPNTKSAEKRARQALKRAAQNRAQRSRLRTAIKKTMQADTPAEAEAALKESAALLDRFATRRLIHPNKAARKKSQLARHVNSLQG